MQWILISGVIVLVLWSLWGYYSSKVEQAAYTVVEKRNGYEIRVYAAHIEAQAVVQGEYQSALNEGFRIIAGYIFGGNKKKAPIAMTAPVTAKESVSEPIAMTAPVTAAASGEGYTIAFVMPASYTLATLPEPNDARVRLVEIPAQRVAAKNIFLWASTGKIQSAQADLLKDMARDNLKPRGKPRYAGYNAPGTPPWLLRNEVLVPIE